MRHSKYTDYGLRVLIYLYNKDESLATTREISDYYNISYNHLTKVVNNLSRAGFLKTSRGRGGGYQLCENRNNLTLGKVVRALENDLYMVECFDPDQQFCSAIPYCRVKGHMKRALDSYFKELDKVYIKDFSTKPLNQSL